METLKLLRTPRGLIYANAICIAAMHLAYLWRAESTELFGTSVLLWAGIGTLLWERRDRLPLESDFLSGALGVALVVLTVLRSLSVAGYHMRVSPAIAFLGLCLLATRARNLSFYWREFVLLGLLVLGPAFTLALTAIDLPTLTTKFSTFLLWYGGLDVAREGTFILLPNGSVEVYGECSGIGSVIQMFNIAVLFGFIVPTTWLLRGIATVVALAIGFIINAGRVGLLAILFAADKPEAFDFWHEGEGSLIFFAISVLLFSGFSWVFLLREPQEAPAVDGDTVGDDV